MFRQLVEPKATGCRALFIQYSLLIKVLFVCATTHGSRCFSFRGRAKLLALRRILFSVHFISLHSILRGSTRPCRFVLSLQKLSLRDCQCDFEPLNESEFTSKLLVCKTTDYRTAVNR